MEKSDDWLTCPLTFVCFVGGCLRILPNVNYTIRPLFGEYVWNFFQASNKQIQANVTPPEIAGLMIRHLRKPNPHWFPRWWFQSYFAYETQHQHGAFAMTGGFKDFLFSSLLGEMIQFD